MNIPDLKCLKSNYLPKLLKPKLFRNQETGLDPDSRVISLEKCGHRFHLICVKILTGEQRRDCMFFKNVDNFCNNLCGEIPQST